MKTLDDLDFSFQRSVKRQVLAHLAQLDFLREGQQRDLCAGSIPARGTDANGGPKTALVRRRGLYLLGLIVAGVVLAIRGSSEGASGRGDGRSGLDILDERFARGEIDREEYEERKRVLLESQRR